MAQKANVVRASQDLTTVPTERVVFLSSNSLWNIQNFRGALVKRLARQGWNVVILAPASAKDSRTWSLPGSVLPVKLSRSGTNPLSDLRLLWAYYRSIRAMKPFAYLSWTIKPNLYGAVAARIAGVPAILNVSGLGTAFLGSRFLGWFVTLLYKLAFRRAYIVFFQNTDDRELFLERRIVSRRQARLLPGSGISLNRFEMTPLPNDGGMIFLMVARLLGDKGIREYVEASRIARRTLPGARFQLLGSLDEGNRSGISSAELDAWVKRGIIEYLGETSDVRPFLAAASAIVLPSYREGLPRTLLEGAAMGRPLIATDVPGCRDVVADGVNGYLCQVKDARSLSSAMVRLAMLDDDARATMGRQSRGMVEAGFNEELVEAAYVNALAELGRRGNREV